MQELLAFTPKDYWVRLISMTIPPNSFLGRKLAFTSGQDIRYLFSNRTEWSVGADQRIRTLTRNNAMKHMGQDERNRKFTLRGGQREHCIIS